MNLNLSFSQKPYTKRKPKEQSDVLNYHGTNGIKGPDITESCFKDIHKAIDKDKPKAKEYLQTLRTSQKGSKEYTNALKGFANSYLPTAMWISSKLGFIQNSTPLERVQEANLFIMESLNHPKIDFNKSIKEVNKFVCKNMLKEVKRKLLNDTHPLTYSHNFWQQRDKLYSIEMNQWDGTAESMEIDYSAAAEKMNMPEHTDHKNKKKKYSIDLLRAYNPKVTKSLSEPATKEGDNDLLIEDTLSEGFDVEKKKEEEQFTLVKKHMGKLKEREQDIIKRSFLKETPDTLKEMGADHNISAPMVRKVRDKAVKKLEQIIEAS